MTGKKDVLKDDTGLVEIQEFEDLQFANGDYGFPLKWETMYLILAPVCQNFEKYCFSCGYVF